MQTYKPVLTKADFERRYRLGEFGNHSPTWESFDEFWASRPWPNRLYHLRNRVIGGATYYNVPGYIVGSMFQRAVEEGVNPKDIYVSEMAPTDRTTFQGEVMRGVWGLELTYTHEKLPMRDALKLSTRTARGIIGVCLLRQFMCPNSYDWLQVLLDRYPDHVVEFSCYDTNWGTLPNFNTVFWEVRKY